jgi:hypothetical protein
MVEAPKGTSGELVDRLMAVVDADPPGVDGWWFDLAIYVAEAVGGEPGPCWPGSTWDVGTPQARADSADERVGRGAYLLQLRARLMVLVTSGLDEAFLVVALRDHIDANLRRLAGGDGATAPEPVGGHRPPRGPRPLRARSPMGRMVVGTMGLTVDDACERWHQLSTWQRLAGGSLSDEIVAAWRAPRQAQ